MTDNPPIPMATAASRPVKLGALGLPEGSAPRRRSKPAQPISSASDRAVYIFFLVQIIGVTVLQKIGIGSTSDTVVPVSLILFLVGMVVLVALQRPVIDPIRAGLFLLWFALAGFGVVIQRAPFSMASMVLFVVLYLPMLVQFRTSAENFDKCLRFFSTVMVGMAGLVIAQHVVQVVASADYWPNIDAMLPPNMLVSGYIYNQPIVWGSHFMKPQAIFFLEVSFLSQFLAIALALEIALFHRVWRIALLTATMLLTFAGTGLLLIALTLPVLLQRVGIRRMAVIVILLVIVFIAAVELGWVGAVSHRLTEFQRQDSSANARFIEPFLRLVSFSSTPDSMISGIGPGNIEKSIGYQWWPITKVVLEYGYLTGIAFYGFFLYVMFRSPRYPAIAFAMTVWYSIEGALLTSVNTIMCILFVTMFLVERPEARGRRRSHRRSTGTRDAAPGS